MNSIPIALPDPGRPRAVTNPPNRTRKLFAGFAYFVPWRETGISFRESVLAVRLQRRIPPALFAFLQRK